MLLCHTGLALSSPVAGFGVSLPSVSFLLRSSFVVFIFSLFVVSGLLAGSLCVLLRIRACTCAVSFMLNFVPCSLDSNFIFRLRRSSVGRGRPHLGPGSYLGPPYINVHNFWTKSDPTAPFFFVEYVSIPKEAIFGAFSVTTLPKSERRSIYYAVRCFALHAKISKIEPHAELKIYRTRLYPWISAG